MDDHGIVTPIARSATLRNVAVYAILVGAYSAIAVWQELRLFDEGAAAPSQLHAALAIVLGWLLVFRTNTAYDRWWEARKLWGRLVNISRNLAIKATTFAPTQNPQQLERLMVAFPYALKDHLRQGAKLSQLPGFDDKDEAVESPQHVPNYVSQQIYLELERWRLAGSLNHEQWRVLDEELRLLLDICGGCERIRNTRVVRSYRVFARQCTVLYLLTLPWGIALEFGWWTVPMTTLTAYFMVGLETVAEHVEEPFGYDEDDLDLEGLCGTIEKTVQEIVQRTVVADKAN